MKAPKAIRFIENFSAEELKRLEDFLVSPYFNKSEALINYFRAAKTLYLGRKVVEGWDADKVWQLSFPQKKFSKSYFDKLNSDLFSRIKTFVQAEQLETPHKKMDREVLFAEKLQEAGLPQLFSIQAKKADKELSDLIRFDPGLLPLYTRLQNAFYNEQIADPRMNLEKVSKKIEKVMEEDFLIQWLKFACGILLNSHRRETDTYFLSHIQSRTEIYRRELMKSQNPIVRVLFCIYELCIDKEEEQNYLFLISWMEEYGRKLPARELEAIMRLSIAFSALKANKSKGVFIKHTHELHRIAEDLGIFLSNKKIRPDVFYFVVQMALQTEDLTWARYFFDKYAPLAEESENQMFVRYLDAKINFSLAQYSTARDILEAGLKAPLRQLVLSWNTRYLLLKCYFKLSEAEKFENLLESTRQFLSRNHNGLGETVQKGQNAIRAFRLLYRFTNYVGGDAGKIEIGNEMRSLRARKIISDPWFDQQV